MSKRQVRFVMGTPMVTDVFHRDRWDYIFTTGIGSEPSEIKSLSLHFEDEKLASINGDFLPQPHEEAARPKKEIVVSVPDFEEPEPSYVDEFLSYIGFTDD